MVDASTRSFDEFYRATVDRVVHLVYATTGNRTLAEDATQEAYAKAWRDWDRIRQHDEPLSWVRTVARRDAISQWRKDSNRARALVRHGADGSVAGPTAVLIRPDGYVAWVGEHGDRHGLTEALTTWFGSPTTA